MVLSGRRYVAVVQEAQGFVQLSLQTGAEAALINVGATVQNHLPGLTGISERQYKAWLQQGRDSLPPQRSRKGLAAPVQDHQVSGSFSVALQGPLQILNLLLQVRRVTLSIQDGRGETQNARAAGHALEILPRCGGEEGVGFRHCCLTRLSIFLQPERRLTFMISQYGWSAMARWQSSNTSRLTLDKSRIFLCKMYKNMWQVMTSTWMTERERKRERK